MKREGVIPRLTHARRLVALWLHRLAARIAGRQGIPTIHREFYSAAIDTWVYPIAFAGQYRQMALDGFVGITQLVQLPDGGWTLQIEQIDISGFARAES